MIADPRYTLTDLYFLFCLKPNGDTAIKYLMTGARQWYILSASLLFEGILRGVVEVYKKEDEFYIRLANNRKQELSGTVNFPPDELVERMLWFLRKQTMPYLMKSFISKSFGDILYPTKKLKSHLVKKDILSVLETKRLWGLMTKTSYPIADTTLHTLLRSKTEALLSRTDTSAPTIQEILFLSLLRKAHTLHALYPQVAVSDSDLQVIIQERIDLLRATLRNHQSSAQQSEEIAPNIATALPASQDIIDGLLNNDEEFSMMLASLEIMIDTMSIALEGIDSFDAGGGFDGGGDGGDGGGGDGGGGGGD